MKKTKEELDRHFWHRLYKVIIWLGSISFGFIISIYLEPESFIGLLCVLLSFSFLGFVFIFFIYRLLLYIALGGKLFFDRKDKNLFIKIVVILIIVFGICIVWSQYTYKKDKKDQRRLKQVTEQQTILCKKNLIESYYDPNMYLHDLQSIGIGSEKRNVLIDTIAFLLKKKPSTVEELAMQEWRRLANKKGWEQMHPLKIKDVVGEIDIDSLDYSDPNFLDSCCSSFLPELPSLPSF